ncbi:MAG: hypothetical protein JO316_17425 [Abitibacteriaceae bacterium]|nr:hypothetical protein [Abditibacteriaceae bacterium]MBV9867139.1 hypothetical protein [Abditibacteriaceae bacterium]
MKVKTQWLATIAVATTGLMAVGASAAGTAKICWEGEKPVTMQAPLVKVPPVPKVDKNDALRPGYSGKGYIEIPWDKNKSKGVGQASYRVNVKTPGVYYLWARTFWANGCGNSIAVAVNGGEPKILGEDGTYNKWHWVGGAVRVALKPGVNTVVLKNRETGICVDQFFLCQDPEYTPVGKRTPTQ